MSFRQTLIRQLTAIIGKRSNISALKLPGPAIIPNPKPLTPNPYRYFENLSSICSLNHRSMTGFLNLHSFPSLAAGILPSWAQVYIVCGLTFRYLATSSSVMISSMSYFPLCFNSFKVSAGVLLTESFGYAGWGGFSTWAFGETSCSTE